MKTRKKSIMARIILAFMPLVVLIISGIVALSAASMPVMAYEGAIISASDDEKGIKEILDLVVNILSVGVGILAVIGISISGIQYLSAGGNEEKTRKSKRRIFEIVIGVAVYVVMYAILKFLLPSFES